MASSILIVEDDLVFSTMMKTWLTKKGFQVDTASANARARKLLTSHTYDLILSDLRLPDQDGIQLLTWLRNQSCNTPLIIMTSYAEIQSAVQAMKHGASDYIAKPIQPDELLNKIEETIRKSEIPLSAAASEFFGHVKGSFTGALTDKTGAFEEANGGTLFLDEIGNLGYEVQVQLLRALQERRIRRIGSTKEIEVDVRLICATNENLKEGIAKGIFREDLYHRINEFTLRIPDLKERTEDILLFANFFLDQANQELERNLIGFDAEASEALQRYTWPGNLRQLKNIVKRATLLAQGNFITTRELGEEILTQNVEPAVASFNLHNEDLEKQRIIHALQRTGNNKTKAAQLLGIDRKTLYNKMKLYDIGNV